MISSKLLFIDDLKGIRTESIFLIKISESEISFIGRLEDNLKISFKPITGSVIFVISNESISESFERSNLTVRVFIVSISFSLNSSESKLFLDNQKFIVSLYFSLVKRYSTLSGILDAREILSKSNFP